MVGIGAATEGQEAIAGFEAEITMLARALEAVQRRRAYPLERAAYLLIGLIEAEGPQPVGEIARRLLLDGSTVTRQVAAMEKAGLVKKAAHPADGRSALVEATSLGRERAGAMRRARLQRLERMFAAWPAGERREAARVLARINLALRNSLEEDR